MHINWFTVIAQVINFLVLVWLLKRFLYKPVLNAVVEREKMIVSQLQEAKAKVADANKEKEEFQKKNEAFIKQKNELIAKTHQEAQHLRQGLLEEARRDAQTLSSKLKNQMKESQNNFNRGIAQKIQEEVFAITRKVMTDMASASLEEQVVHVFLERVNQLSSSEKEQLVKTLKSSTDPVLVSSAFELTLALKEEIEKSIGKLFDSQPRLEFNVSPELINGIELEANGYKLGWSISNYLDEFQKNISENDSTKILPENGESWQAN